MKLSRDTREALELHFDLNELEAVLELETGLDANWGQTIFVLHASGCWGLTRSSYSDPYRKFLMDPRQPCTVRERQFEDTFTITAADGRELPIKLYLKDLDAARAFAEAFTRRAESLPAPEPEPEPVKKGARPKSVAKTTAAKAAPPTGVSGLDPDVQILHDPMDPVDAAGNSMQNFFERVIARIGDVPLPDSPGPRTEKPSDPPSPEFISLVDTGDVFAKMPSKWKQATEAYMSAWDRRHDPQVSLKLAALFEQKLDLEALRVWLERAVDALPPGKERNHAAARLIQLLQKLNASAETIVLWQSKIV